MRNRGPQGAERRRCYYLITPGRKEGVGPEEASKHFMRQKQGRDEDQWWWGCWLVRKLSGCPICLTLLRWQVSHHRNLITFTLLSWLKDGWHYGPSGQDPWTAGVYNICEITKKVAFTVERFSCLRDTWHHSWVLPITGVLTTVAVKERRNVKLQVLPL